MSEEEEEQVGFVIASDGPVSGIAQLALQLTEAQHGDDEPCAGCAIFTLLESVAWIAANTEMTKKNGEEGTREELHAELLEVFGKILSGNQAAHGEHQLH